MSGDLQLRPMAPPDWPAVARLVHRSTNAWYEQRGLGPIFACTPADVELFCRVYESLDPGCCVLAERDGVLVGSCFWHPRPTHVGLGIMNTAPEAFGRGVARQLLQFVVERGEERCVPIRLVSSAINLDSFSLYNRAGFAPYAVYQDMTLAVPENGFAAVVPGRSTVRDARLDDVPALVALEREVSGIERERDFRAFIENREGVWHVSVLDGPGGRLDGFLASVWHAASEMLGPGVARDDDAALALIAAELDHHRGGAPVWLAPSDRPRLLAALYGFGARNVELHFAQSRGPAQRPTGVVLPTFMPETG